MIIKNLMRLPDKKRRALIASLLFMERLVLFIALSKEKNNPKCGSKRLRVIYELFAGRELINVSRH